MARTVTRAQLRTRARQMANMENATAVWPDADVNERIDTHTTAIWDMIVSLAPPHYYSSSTTVSVVVGTIAYALPADFMSLQEVYVQQGAVDKLRALRPLRRGERGWTQAPTRTASVTVEYTPNFTTFSSDSSTLDGVDGWDELVVAYVARDLLTKVRESGEQMDQKIAEVRARMMKLGNRDRGNPRLVRDVEDDDSGWWGAAESLAGYRLRAGNIEIFEYGQGLFA